MPVVVGRVDGSSREILVRAAGPRPAILRPVRPCLVPLFRPSTHLSTPDAALAAPGAICDLSHSGMGERGRNRPTRPSGGPTEAPVVSSQVTTTAEASVRRTGTARTVIDFRAWRLAR